MELERGWEVAACAPGVCGGPAEASVLEWQPASVPGTAAGAIGVDGRDFDAEDWWFRCRFDRPQGGDSERLILVLGGIATVAEVFLNGERLLESSSMWEEHTCDVTERVRQENVLMIACRALTPLLSVRRRPAARWRTRTVNNGNLRWYRTMIFGRAPGSAPGPAAVGPWRGVRLERLPKAGFDKLSVASRLEGATGVVSVRGRPRGAIKSAEVQLGDLRAQMALGPEGSLTAELRVPGVVQWWPHTHGEPVLHEISVEVDGAAVDRRRIGFRRLAFATDVLEDGLRTSVNDVPIFVRGAVWTPADLLTMAPTYRALRALLERARDAGMNMLRIAGTGAYESDAFHDLCDELGILVWQDLMFANLDYPFTDDEFREKAFNEARTVIDRLAWRPSLAVVCGNSEVEQQPAMLGLDPTLGHDQSWEGALGKLVTDSGADCAFVPSTPTGGDLPFHTAGLCHYFGVSGYMRPPSDARLAGVRFASECLAFANVPDEVLVPVHHPTWKSGVQRDAGSGWGLGAGWDFDDVRDYYVRYLFDVDPAALRRFDHARYLELGRAASGEVMAEVMGEWRRPDSGCSGALVLWLKDMLPGAGLGVIDHTGGPKVAYHHLRRALRPVAVWLTDEGLSGVAIHLANDRPAPLRATLRVALYRDLQQCVEEISEPVELPPHSYTRRTVEGMIGRFVDAAWAYRFGPPTTDLIVASLELASRPQTPVSQAFAFPAGRPTAVESASRLGLEARHESDAHGSNVLRVRTERLVYGLRIHLPGFEPEDDALSVEPGHERVIALRPAAETTPPSGGSLTAINLDGVVRLAL
jgi:beta-mannosidase